MRAIDPRNYLDDPDVHPLVLHQRADLTAADIVTAGSGAYVIFNKVVPAGQIYVLKTMVPYAQERVNVGLADESYQMIDPGVANTFMSFEPAVDRGSPFVIESDVNAARLFSAPLNNDRTSNNGITFISLNPWADAQNSMFNPLFTIVARGNRTLRVVFRIVASGAVSPEPGTFSIGGVTAFTKRVDLAGVVFAGVQMSEQTYDGILSKLHAQTGEA